jgi:hypothetical protein
MLSLSTLKGNMDRRNMVLRIHGDNIIECERTLLLIAEAFHTQANNCSDYIYYPKYRIETYWGNIEVEFLAGHDRWGVSISKELTEYGAPLREAADSYVALVHESCHEEILFAIEYCNALPAGNNAWQRNGRAITCAEIGIPYLYFAEIGGVELDSKRRIKAPRFPNPIVPFSYLTSSRIMNSICMPVYQAHPAITGELKKKFAPVFGIEMSLNLIRYLIEKDERYNTVEKLENKGLSLVHILSEERRTYDTFRGNEWDFFLGLKSSLEKVDWIKNLTTKQIWKKKTATKVAMTKTFKQLLENTVALNCLSIGAKDIPICLLVNGNIKEFASLLKTNYNNTSIHDIANAIYNKNTPLLIVWLTGFKPRGDDSRPDRGLVPLARMLFGNDIDILSIVYGPAKPATWKKFNENYNLLAEGNGLWQAIINLSNYIFVDSTTSQKGAMGRIVDRNLKRNNKPVFINVAKFNIIFGEHDVDTSIHSLFTKGNPENIFEAMCNPPGGDWSGISYFNYNDSVEYRWTSLPRVSANKAKRPDHVIQLNINKAVIFLSIESKNTGANLENNIGNRLKSYINYLFKNKPTAFKKKNEAWALFSGKNLSMKNYSVYSGGAFCFKNDDEIKSILKIKKLDFIIAFQFENIPNHSILHIHCGKQCSFLIDLLSRLCKNFSRNIEIKIH